MNQPQIEDLLTQHRMHLAHQQRELYEFNIDAECPCRICTRDRFEARVTVLLTVAIVPLMVALVLLSRCAP